MQNLNAVRLRRDLQGQKPSGERVDQRLFRALHCGEFREIPREPLPLIPELQDGEFHQIALELRADLRAAAVERPEGTAEMLNQRRGSFGLLLQLPERGGGRTVFAEVAASAGDPLRDLKNPLRLTPAVARQPVQPPEIVVIPIDPPESRGFPAENCRNSARHSPASALRNEPLNLP